VGKLRLPGFDRSGAMGCLPGWFDMTGWFKMTGRFYMAGLLNMTGWLQL
jgi:hypothetical protein